MVDFEIEKAYQVADPEVKAIVCFTSNDSCFLVIDKADFTGIPKESVYLYDDLVFEPNGESKEIVFNQVPSVMVLGDSVVCECDCEEDGE